MTHGAALLLLLAPPGAAQEELRGTWRGGYVCRQGHTAMALTIEPRKDGTLSGLFHFQAAADNPGVPTGCYEVRGRFDPTTRRMVFEPLRWLLRPDGYVMVGLDGRLAPDGAAVEGEVLGPGCTTFRVEHSPAAQGAEACRTGAPLLSLR